MVLQKNVLTHLTHLNVCGQAVYMRTRVKLMFASHIKFTRSKLSNLSAHVTGVTDLSLWTACLSARSAYAEKRRPWAQPAGSTAAPPPPIAQLVTLN